jgi:hypothetical protein
MIKIRGKTTFRPDKVRDIRYFTAVYSIASATEKQYQIGTADIVKITEDFEKIKKRRSVGFSSQRFYQIENKVRNKALEWSSGNLPYAYISKEKPYSRKNPKIAQSYWHIINDHSMDATVPRGYDGRQFKRSWNIHFTFRLRDLSGILLIENYAPYSLFIRMTEIVNSRQVPRPIFSKLMQYARNQILRS